MENYIVSARKYRPTTFAQVVGQTSITTTLKSAIVNNHLAQAFLFTGPRGVGKTTCARILAKTINCLNPTSGGEPCNQCESCVSFNDNASFNIHELDAASNNSVEDIRSLVDQVRILPQAGKYKVYIIDEVHMLSAAAFNAFLKTLEEPPAYAKFILATTEKHKIIPTILSRCQIFDFKRIGVEDIAKYLAYVANSEHIEADIEALHIIAEKSDGALRDALSTFDQIFSYSGKKITYIDVIENLNILDYEYYFRVTEALLKADIAELLLIFDEINERGFDGQQFLTGLSEHFRNLLVVKNPRTVPLLQSSASVVKRYKEQALICERDFLYKVLEVTNKYDLNYKSSNNKRLHVEIALTRLAALIMSPAATQQQKPTPQNLKNPEIVSNPRVSEPVVSYHKSTKQNINQQAKSETEKTEQIPLQKNLAKQELQPEKTISHKTTNPLQTTLTQTTERKTLTSAIPGITKQNGRVLRNISIKESLDEIKRKKEQQKEKKTEIIKNDFTQEMLQKVWDTFVDVYKEKSPSFVNTLAKTNPQLKDDYIIEYTVPNAIVANDTLNVSVLKNFLIKELNNNQLKLKTIIIKTEQTKEAYTDRERFDELQKKYPKLTNLKNRMNLELEF